MNSSGSTRFHVPAVAMIGMAVTGMMCSFQRPALAENSSQWRVGLARACITPEAPIRMAGYANRVKPSEGVLSDLYAKALAIQYADGEPAVLLTADLAGYDASLAEAICAAISKKTGLKRPQILLSVSHTHTGPVVGLAEKFGYSVSDEERQVVRQYTEKLLGQLVEISAVALADMKPARLSWGVGVAGFVMNRRDFTDRGVQLGTNPSGYADRSVPVLRIDSPEGSLRALVFGCATHNTTLGGMRQISGDYAGFAQQYLEEQQRGVQAMFMTGCAGSANPYPHGTVELARQHGAALGAEVCRVAGGRLQGVGGPLRVEIEYAELPLQAIPPRERLEQMASKGKTGPAFNAHRMLAALKDQRPLPTHYRAPVAVWQFGGDLTLLGLSGEVVGEYVPLLQAALGHRRLWIAAYCNDFFGYLPTATVLEEGGYETRGLITDVGYFAPEAEQVLVAKARELARKAGRKNP